MGLGSEDAYTTQLQAIMRIAHDMRQVAAVSLPSTHTTTSIPSHKPILTDSIKLPAPSSLLPVLVEAGVNSEVASAANQIYQRRAEQLRQYIQDSIVNACRAFTELPAHNSALPLDLFIKRVTSIFMDRLKEWKEEIVQRIKQALEPPVKETLRDSRVFNQEYTPLLEHFFKENPFPTRADKTFLARKSGMQYRQIHVWFQNRRNRSKKEGKTLRKKPTHEGVTKPLDDLPRRMKGHVVGSVCVKTREVVSLEGTAVAAIPQNNRQDTFTSTPPLHAYPSYYPPTCHYDPFPCKSGPVRFDRPEWRRASCSKRSHHISTSMDLLVERFSQLNVRDETRAKGSPTQSHAATAAITIIPFPAPHPSLIVRTYHQPTNNSQRHLLIRAPTSNSKVFQISSPSNSVTLVPLLNPPGTSELPGIRKTAPLPRRLPGRLRDTNRDSTLSDSSSTSSASPRSFHLDETPSGSSSVSSLSTPSGIASPQELPLMFGSPCGSLLDSSIFLQGLGDMVP